MPELETLENTSSFTPSEGEVVTFYTQENGKTLLKAKKSDGSVVTVLEEN